MPKRKMGDGWSDKCSCCSTIKDVFVAQQKTALPAINLDAGKSQQTTQQSCSDSKLNSNNKEELHRQPCQ